MRQLALKRIPSLAIVPASETVRVELSPATSLVPSFRAWLTPVPKNADVRRPRPLTTEDFVQVELATVRESNRHAIWPTEVIAQFLDAELDL
jgi:hypothetical protein